MDFSKAIFRFFFITDSKFVCFEDMEFFFVSEKYKNGYKLDNENMITIFPQYPKSCVYYYETISIKYKNIEIINFDYLVHINKENNIIIDLDEEKGSSFELLFYAKYAELIPSKVSYKNEEYNFFDRYGNKKRERIFFANADPNQLQYINSKEMRKYKFNFSNQTYQVLLRIYQKEKFEISMTNMDSYLAYNIKFELPKKKIKKEELENLKQKINDFYNKYIIYTSLNPNMEEEKVIKAYKELKALATDIKKNASYKFFEDTELYEKNLNFDDGLLSLFHKNFSLSQFIKLKEAKLDNFERIRKKILENKEKEEKLYNKLINDKNTKIEQKIKILRTLTIFCENSLFSNKKIFGIDYININNLSPDDPYYKSNKMLKKIISELNEDSRLFEAFMYFDSKVIQNILEKNECKPKVYKYKDEFDRNIEIKQPEFITEYGMSLLTLEEIKQHLLNLLPEIIIKIDTNINMRALFEYQTGIMIINEYIMFGDFFENNKTEFLEKPGCYIVPISMEILHELLAHGKLRYNKENEESPLVIRDSKHDFKVQVLMKEIKIDLFNKIKVNKGETGRVLEHYISENKNVINLLKAKTDNKKILDTKYWTGTNFEDLHKELKEKNENGGDFSEIILDSCDDDDFDNYECIF